MVNLSEIRFISPPCANPNRKDIRYEKGITPYKFCKASFLAQIAFTHCIPIHSLPHSPFYGRKGFFGKVLMRIPKDGGARRIFHFLL